MVDFIYEVAAEGPRTWSTDADANEEVRVGAIADGSTCAGGVRLHAAVGGRPRREYTSPTEVVQPPSCSKGRDPEWVTVVVKPEVGKTARRHFEAFQICEVCVKLFKDRVLETKVKDSDDPRLSKMRKEVIAGGKDTMEVDNDFFLAPVKISDHQGPLSTGFLVENRGIPLPASALRRHMDRAKHLPFVKRISDFHVLLQIAAFLDVKADVPTLAPHRRLGRTARSSRRRDNRFAASSLSLASPPAPPPSFDPPRRQRLLRSTSPTSPQPPASPPLLRQEDDHGRPHRARSGSPARGAFARGCSIVTRQRLPAPRLEVAAAIKRAGFLYGRVDTETKEVMVDFIYESPQQGSSAVVQLMRDADEEARLDAIADGLGMRRVGFVFMQAVGRKASETGEYTLSNSEVVQAAQLQAEGGIPEWVTAVVNLEDRVLETKVKDSDDPRLSKMRKEVIAGGKDTMEVDNDFFPGAQDLRSRGPLDEISVETVEFHRRKRASGTWIVQSICLSSSASLISTCFSRSLLSWM
ncbi:hypothetical protein ZWY2020_057362 [Hordeum vulgare]|nr:hypothetical protein ZWY2020_057362 [Hordeum vulgare]